ncbi:MAG: tetratricopeptide repeat protein, partial [Gammaproteobacteria bacterium]
MPHLEEEFKRTLHTAQTSDDPLVHYNLGIMYANGRGVEKDYGEAARWYRKSAEQGFAQAQHSLGWMYENGHGVEKDEAKAVKWYRKSAEQGD